MYLKSHAGFPQWLSGLRILHCHCCGSGHCYGVGLIPGPGTSTCCGHGQNKVQPPIISSPWPRPFWAAPPSGTWPIMTPGPARANPHVRRPSAGNGISRRPRIRRYRSPFHIRTAWGTSSSIRAETVPFLGEYLKI